MSVVLSLLQAIVQIDGDALVLHVGEKPYVVAPSGQVDLATGGLTFDAVFGILVQLLPAESQAALEEFGAVQYELPRIPEFAGEHFTVVAARGGDDVWMEVRRRRVPDNDLVPLELFGPTTAAASDALRPEVTDVRTGGVPFAMPSHPASHSSASTESGDDGLAMPDIAQLWPDSPSPAPPPVFPAMPRVLAPIVAAPTRQAEAPLIFEPRVAERPRAVEPSRMAELPRVSEPPPPVIHPPGVFVSPASSIFAPPPAVAGPSHVAVTPPPAIVTVPPPASAEPPVPAVVAPAPWPVFRPMVIPVGPPAPEPLVEVSRIPVMAAATPSAPDVVIAVTPQRAPLESPDLLEAVQEWARTPPPSARVETPPQTRVGDDESLWATIENVPEPTAVAELTTPEPVIAWPLPRKPEPVIAAAPPSRREPLIAAPPPPPPPVAPPRSLEATSRVLASGVVSKHVETPAEEPGAESGSAWADVETELDAIVATIPVPPPHARIAATASTPVPDAFSVKPPESVEPTPRAVPVPPPAWTLVIENAAPLPERDEVVEPVPPAPLVAAAPARAVHVPPPPFPPLPTQHPYIVETPFPTEAPFRMEAPIPMDTPRHSEAPRSMETWSVPPPEPAVVLPMTRTQVRREMPQTGAESGMIGLDHLLRLAATRGASTLYLSSNTRPSVRLDGDVHILDGAPILSANEVEALLLSVMPGRQADALRTGVASEWICDLPDLGRVRCMNFRDHRGPGGVFRMVPARAITSEQLGLSLEIQSLAVEREGLVLIAGPRSSGKRTLIGGLVDLISRTRRDHMITVEREVNVVQDRHASLISQREARGLDDTLAAARGALREDPDILVLHEARSAPLMTLALEAAAAGRLVIAGFTAHSAGGAIERIVDLYPPEYARQVQLSLAQQLRGVVGQVLLQKVGGGRIAAREVLLNTPAMARVLAEGKTWQLPAAFEAGRQHGMASLNEALVGLVQSGAVAADEAYRRAPDPTGLVEALNEQGIDTSFTQRLA